MENNNKNALHKESKKLDIPIIPQNNLDFVYQDFDNSSINRDVTDRYSKSFLSMYTIPSQSLSFDMPKLFLDTCT